MLRPTADIPGDTGVLVGSSHLTVRAPCTLFAGFMEISSQMTFTTPPMALIGAAAAAVAAIASCNARIKATYLRSPKSTTTSGFERDRGA